MILGSISVGGKMSNTNIDLQSLIGSVTKVFDWASEQNANYDEDRNSTSDKSIFKIAINIFNKSRNLPGSYDKLKALLKGMTAYLFNLYGNTTAKCLSTVIKYLSKATEELSQFDVYTERAIKCAKTCTTLWIRIRDSANLLIKQLSHQELDSLKLSVFHSYTQTAMLLVSLKDAHGQEDSPRQAIAGAMELINQLPAGIKLNFVYNAMHICKELIKKNSQEDAFSIYNLIISVVDSISSSAPANISEIAQDDEPINENYVNASKYELFRTKIQILLSMAYCCMTTNQCDKAMLHLKTAEQAIEKAKFEKKTFTEKDKLYLIATLDYAKFSICSVENNWAAAEVHLRSYMKQANSYETALELITTFLKGNQLSSHKYTIEFYGMLLTHFPNEPFFTNTRISNLEMCVANISIHGEQTVTSEISQNKRALDLCDAIIIDHLSGHHSLNYQETDSDQENTNTPKNYKRLIKVLIGRVKWYYSSSEWAKLKEWADMYFKLHGDKELDDDTMNVMIYKVEALLSENIHKSSEDALALTLKMATTRTTTRSIISLFKALLFTRGAKDAVKHFIDLQNNREVDGNSLGRTENLSRIIECLFIVNESSQSVSSQQCKLAKQLLLNEWLKQFSEVQYWRYEGYTNEANEGKISYFKVCKQLLQIYLIEDDNDQPKQANDIERVSAEPVNENRQDDVDSDFTELAKMFGTIIKFNAQPPSIALTISLEEFYTNISNPLQQLCNIISLLADTDEIKKLGSDDDLEWLADFAWNLGILFSKKQPKINSGSTSAELTAATIKQRDYHLLASEMLEISSQLYGNVENEVKAISISNQVMGLIASCGCRLDMDSSDSRGTGIKHDTIISNKRNEFYVADSSSDSVGLSSCFDKSESNTTPKQSSPKRSNELLKTIELLEFAESLVRSLIGFADDSYIDNYKTILLVFLISAHMRLQDDAKLQEFMKKRERDFFNLSAHQLRLCAAIAKAEFLSDISRTFLNFANQVCVRNEPRDYALMGQIFSEIIENSASRSHALENIQEFEQLVKQNAQFSQDDIDGIAKLAYNYGVTLLELDQIDIAEKFLSMSLSLSNFASESFKANLSNMSNSYAFVLEKKAAAVAAKAKGMDLLEETPRKLTFGEKEKDVALTLASLV